MLAGKTLLLVESDREIRDLLHDCFDLLGYRVLTANNGQEALAYLGVSGVPAPDVVFLDLVGGEDARQLLERIRRDPEVARVPVVVLTPPEVGGHVGLSALLKEPERLHAVIDTVRRYLEAVAKANNGKLEPA